MTKKTLLIISSVLTLLFAALVLSVDVLRYEFCAYSCQRTIIDVGESFFFFPYILFFSLLTYFAPERVFQSWWRFARIGIPVAFVSALVINLELLLSPSEQWGALFSIPALIIIYGAFTIASAWQIWKGWRAK